VVCLLAPALILGDSITPKTPSRSDSSASVSSSHQQNNMEYDSEQRTDYAYEEGREEGGERGGRDGEDYARRNSRSPDRRSQSPRRQESHAGSNENEGSNLFVTGLAIRVDEEELKDIFGKYGEVEKSSIMLDPHTRESRGFGFVKFANAEHADQAKEGLQGVEISGRTLNIERARRSRPRTPTPGKYYGPPKRDFRGSGRFDDRRGGRRYEDDRYYGSRGGGAGGDRYGDRYGGDRYERRGGYGGDRYGGDRYGADRYGGGDRYGGDRGYSRRDRYDDRYAEPAAAPSRDRYADPVRAAPTEDRYGGARDPYSVDDRYARR